MFRILTDFGLTDDTQSDFLWELLFRSIFMNGLIKASGESDQQWLKRVLADLRKNMAVSHPQKDTLVFVRRACNDEQYLRAQRIGANEFFNACFHGYERDILDVLRLRPVTCSQLSLWIMCGLIQKLDMARRANQASQDESPPRQERFMDESSSGNEDRNMMLARLSDLIEDTS
jgi:hypothetical protein